MSFNARVIKTESNSEGQEHVFEDVVEVQAENWDKAVKILNDNGYEVIAMKPILTKI